MTAPSRSPARNAIGPPATLNSTAGTGRVITLRKLNRNVVANCAHMASSHGGGSAALTVPEVKRYAPAAICIISDDGSNANGESYQPEFEERSPVRARCTPTRISAIRHPVHGRCDAPPSTHANHPI